MYSVKSEASDPIVVGSLEPNGAFWSKISVPPRWLAAEGACAPTHARPPPEGVSSSV